LVQYIHNTTNVTAFGIVKNTIGLLNHFTMVGFRPLIVNFFVLIK